MRSYSECGFTQEVELMTHEAVTDVRGDALRLLSSGLYVLTTCAADAIHAAAVSWVSQVSFQPPLVMMALRRNTHLAQAVRKGHRFALNILASDQAAMAEPFLGSVMLPASDQTLAGLAFRSSPAHCPLLTDALGWLECRLAAELSTPGDHCLLLGEVTGAGIRRTGTPLTLRDTPWSYGGLREP
jgi:flavin reductase (DIM6/NTAB) family NADH-FMN oxidoreductase RutF